MTEVQTREFYNATQEFWTLAIDFRESMRQPESFALTAACHTLKSNSTSQLSTQQTTKYATSQSPIYSACISASKSAIHPANHLVSHLSLFSQQTSYSATYQFSQQTINQTAIQPANQLVNYLSNQSANQPVSHLFTQLPNHTPLNQSVITIIAATAWEKHSYISSLATNCRAQCSAVQCQQTWLRTVCYCGQVLLRFIRELVF